MLPVRSDDYVKNMIRRMLVEEGWVRGEEVTDPGFPLGTTAIRYDFSGPKIIDEVITIGPDCEPQVLVDA